MSCDRMRGLSMLLTSEKDIGLITNLFQLLKGGLPESVNASGRRRSHTQTSQLSHASVLEMVSLSIECENLQPNGKGEKGRIEG